MKKLSALTLARLATVLTVAGNCGAARAATVLTPMDQPVVAGQPDAAVVTSDWVPSRRPSSSPSGAPLTGAMAWSAWTSPR